MVAVTPEDIKIGVLWEAYSDLRVFHWGRLRRPLLSFDCFLVCIPEPRNFSLHCAPLSSISIVNAWHVNAASNSKRRIRKTKLNLQQKDWFFRIRSRSALGCAWIICPLQYVAMVVSTTTAKQMPRSKQVKEFPAILLDSLDSRTLPGIKFKGQPSTRVRV